MSGRRADVARAAAVVRVVSLLVLVAVGLSRAVGLLDRLPDLVRAVASVAALPAIVGLLLGLLVGRFARPSPPAPLPLRCPVTGRWRAMNGPATKVPSHGTHLYGQTYAIDLVHDPAPGTRPRFGGWYPMRDPRDFPAFGQPVLAPVTGRVAAARHRSRDHRGRNNLLGYLYMLGEGVVLSLRGASGLMGNHVTIEHDGVWVTVAHLQRGSVTVKVGDHVVAGQRIAAVGNSGNSSEPHVHLQVTDRRQPSRALGLPFVFTDVVLAKAIEPPAELVPTPIVPPDHRVFHAGVGVSSEASG